MPKKLQKGINDFKTLYPDIAAEWAYDLNGDLTPDSIFPGSTVKVWWRCSNTSCGHVWQSWLSDRKGGHGCPECRKRNKRVDDNLLSKYPLLAEEWNYEMNETLRPEHVAAGSHNYAWWTCKKCGGSWRAKINNRTYGNNGCPTCTKENKTSFPEQAILFYVKKLPYGAVSRFTSNWFDNGKRGVNPEIDVYIPTLGVGIEYDGQAFHNDPERDMEKSNLCEDLGITLYRIREYNCPDLEMDEERIQTVISRNEASLGKAIKSILNSIESQFKLCDNIDVDIARDRQDIYSMMDFSVKESSFQDLYPELAREWDYEKNGSLTPDKVSPKSGMYVYWKCPVCGESYRARVANRANGSGCTHCAHRKGAKERWASQKNINKITAA